MGVVAETMERLPEVSWQYEKPGRPVAAHGHPSLAPHRKATGSSRILLGSSIGAAGVGGCETNLT